MLLCHGVQWRVSALLVLYGVEECQMVILQCLLTKCQLVWNIIWCQWVFWRVLVLLGLYSIEECQIVILRHPLCHTIMLTIRQGMVIVNTWVFILRRYKWHIHAGSWSLVNCWREALTRPYIGCSWILMNAAVGHMDGSALMVIGVSTWYPNIPLSSWKKRLCLHAKKLLLEIYHGP